MEYAVDQVVRHLARMCLWPACLPAMEKHRLAESVLAELEGRPDPYPFAGNVIYCPHWCEEKETSD
jgi:hypothetical protein